MIYFKVICLRVREHYIMITDIICNSAGIDTSGRLIAVDMVQ